MYSLNWACSGNLLLFPEFFKEKFLCPFLLIVTILVSLMPVYLKMVLIFCYRIENVGILVGKPLLAIIYRM